MRGRSKPLAFFVHKNVSNLPEYLTFGTKILDRYDFYKWAKDISSDTAIVEDRIRLQKSVRPNALLDLLEIFVMFNAQPMRLRRAVLQARFWPHTPLQDE